MCRHLWQSVCAYQVGGGIMENICQQCQNEQQSGHMLHRCPLVFTENITVGRSNTRSGSGSHIENLSPPLCISSISLYVFLQSPPFPSPRGSVSLLISVLCFCAFSSHLSSLWLQYFVLSIGCVPVCPLVSYYFSPSIFSSSSVRPSTDTASTQINYLKLHLMLFHTHTHAHTDTHCNGSLTLSWEPNLVLTR